MIAKGERNIHEDATAFGAEAHDHCFGVFAALAALFGSMERGRMDAEMKALVVQNSDRVSDNLIGKFTDGFTDQFVSARQFRARQAAREGGGSFLVNINNDAAFDVAESGKPRPPCPCGGKLLLPWSGCSMATGIPAPVRARHRRS